MRRTIPLVIAVALVAAGCGADDRVSTDAGAFDAGAPADGGSGPDSGERPDAASPCPSSPPSDAAACTMPRSCTWLSCAAYGIAQASCDGTRWTVTMRACGMEACEFGMASCAADQVCVERRSGAVIRACEANPCPPGVFDASCACSVCGGSPCTVDGTLVTCTIDCGGCP